jgi:alpha-beta hydrolase superfamily lysophospholipase
MPTSDVLDGEAIALSPTLAAHRWSAAEPPAVATLLVLHGYGDHALYAAPVITARGPRVAALALDLPGHGYVTRRIRSRLCTPTTHELRCAT